MGIFGALRSAGSGLQGQSQAMSMISDNIANSRTIGYKRAHAQFSSLVTTSTSSTLYSSGGVQSRTGYNIEGEANILSTEHPTNMAISGNGFFAVTRDLSFNPRTGEYDVTGDIFYTRAGEFFPDKDGNLVNPSGFYALGYTRNDDDTGFNVTTIIDNLKGINVSREGSAAQPTQNVNLQAVLNAEADVDEVFEFPVQIFDRLGAARTMTLRFTKMEPGNRQDILTAYLGRELAADPTFNRLTRTAQESVLERVVNVIGNPTDAQLPEARARVNVALNQGAGAGIRDDAGTVDTILGALSEFPATVPAGGPIQPESYRTFRIRQNLNNAGDPVFNSLSENNKRRVVDALAAAANNGAALALGRTTQSINARLGAPAVTAAIDAAHPAPPAPPAVAPPPLTEAQRANAIRTSLNGTEAFDELSPAQQDEVVETLAAGGLRIDAVAAADTDITFTDRIAGVPGSQNIGTAALEAGNPDPLIAAIGAGFPLGGAPPTAPTQEEVAGTIRAQLLADPGFRALDVADRERLADALAATLAGGTPLPAALANAEGLAVTAAARLPIGAVAGSEAIDITAIDNAVNAGFDVLAGAAPVLPDAVRQTLIRNELTGNAVFDAIEVADPDDATAIVNALAGAADNAAADALVAENTVENIFGGGAATTALLDAAALAAWPDAALGDDAARIAAIRANLDVAGNATWDALTDAQQAGIAGEMVTNGAVTAANAALGLLPPGDPGIPAARTTLREASRDAGLAFRTRPPIADVATSSTIDLGELGDAINLAFPGAGAAPSDEARSALIRNSLAPNAGFIALADDAARTAVVTALAGAADAADALDLARTNAATLNNIGGVAGTDAIDPAAMTAAITAAFQPVAVAEGTPYDPPLDFASARQLVGEALRNAGNDTFDGLLPASQEAVIDAIAGDTDRTREGILSNLGRIPGARPIGTAEIANSILDRYVATRGVNFPVPPRSWAIDASINGNVRFADSALMPGDFDPLPAGEEGSDITSTSGGALGQVTFDASGALLNYQPNTLDPPSTNTRDTSIAERGIGQGEVSFTVNLDHDNNLNTFGEDSDQTAVRFVLGSLNDRNGLSYSALRGEQVGRIEDYSQDGKRFGTLTSVQVSTDGVISGGFDNGEFRPVFQIPVVSFNSPNQMRPLTGTIFAQTRESDQPVVHVAGTVGTGEIRSGALEESNVDIADEFSRMIFTHRAYSANTKILSTGDEMLTELTRAIR